jgi:hypothetical protein
MAPIIGAVLVPNSPSCRLRASQATTASVLTPVVQAQDRTFYGTDGNMDKLDQCGNIQWSVPGDTPQIATADDGVVGASGTTYDANGGWPILSRFLRKGGEDSPTRNPPAYYLRATPMARTSLVRPPPRCYVADSDADPPLR